MYRFLGTPRWLGLAALSLALCAGMVGLGYWQLGRYHQRAAINDRVDAAVVAPPVPVTELSQPGAKPADEKEYRQVTASGVFDQANVILARGRTLDNRVGFEVLVPLRLADGSAVLVDRGWVPPAVSGLNAQPTVPAVPSGPVTVTGRLRLPESSPGPVDRARGALEVRRIDPARIAKDLSYPVLGGWISAERADPGFTAVPARPDRQPTWMNMAYVIQWWLFAGMALFGYFWLARKEAGTGDTRRGGGALPSSG
ncbi:SURF1 family protein [Longispora sp. K20-0274]|uniref:SURF1 family cytochrome oxidase biogenesis protein n=1 Tax=Longispora sp. K20-0274 TaxID=3088255 RepID=UPI00399AE0F9